MDGLLSAFKFIHILSADIIKFICNSGELVCRMWRL